MIELWILRGRGIIRSFPAIRHAPVCILLVSLSGCISASTRFDDAARNIGFNKSVVSSSKFQHAIYENAVTLPGADSLHVYIGSDGTPWTSSVPAKDPTPRNPLTLRLMMVDTHPAILVGRPCYHGLSSNDGCDASIWTSARYSEIVVKSIADVIDEYLNHHSYESVTLIGYSGGGTLATLVAARLDQATMLLTVAPNLDIDAWTSYHGYEPLSGSINPADEPPLPESVRQVHNFGALDANVPISTTDRYFSVNSSAERREVPGFDHVCCWTEIWQSILPVTE